MEWLLAQARTFVNELDLPAPGILASAGMPLGISLKSDTFRVTTADAARDGAAFGRHAAKASVSATLPDGVRNDIADNPTAPASGFLGHLEV